MPEQQFHQFHNNHYTARYKYDKYYKKYIIPFCTYKNPIWINCGLCSMIIFLVIAIITFTLGCNPNINNTCMNYYIVDITIEKYGMHNDTCNTAYCHVPSPNGIGCLVFFTAPQCNIMIICDILYIKYHKHNITLGYVFVYKLCDFYLKNHTIYIQKQYRVINHMLLHHLYIIIIHILVN